MHDPGDEHTEPRDETVNVSAERFRCMQRIGIELVRLTALGLAALSVGDKATGDAICKQAGDIATAMKPWLPGTN